LDERKPGSTAEQIEDGIHRLLDSRDPRRTDPLEFFGAQFDAGLAFVHFPVGLGGLGLAARHQQLIDDRLRTAGAKKALHRNPIGIGMGMPTVHGHGNAAQMHRYFRRCFTSEEIWCQLFSEPGAGSDLASLSTKAELDGDEWVITGQKVWTSGAHLADIGLLLARTDPDVPKHKGITCFLLDMHSAGVDVRPLRQMTGESEFNEVFLSGARIPDACRIGEVGSGWGVATTTLTNERLVLSGAGRGTTALGGSPVEKLVDAARGAGPLEGALRDDLVRRWIESKVILWTNRRASALARAGSPGPQGSTTKLSQALHNRRVQDTALRLHGASSMAWNHADVRSESLVRGFLRAQANTIEGGTSNVLRNIAGEKVLGLPREPGYPSGTPWSKIPKNQ
jgi:alkylation response protein AidB-like acyl-CoA dehydrogenase